MPFNLEDAIQVANQVVAQQCDRPLSDVETLVLQGTWQRLDYDQMAAQGRYSSSYLSQDVAPKLWKRLSEALGKKVRKSNFRTVIARTSSLASVSRPYVERPPIEQLLFTTLLEPGALVRLKAPRFSGKTTLVSTVLNQVASQHYRIVQLSLEMADRNTHFTDLARFLRWLCLNVSRELGLPNRLDDYWNAEDMGVKVSCTAYVEEYLLRQSNAPLILCLDDVDLLFPHPEIYEDFFGLLRSWYEKARTRDVWARLRLIIVHSTDVYIRLQIQQSPFNVGLPLQLPEFTPQQIHQMATLYQVELAPADLEALVNLVGGHPALIEQVCIHLKTYPHCSIQQLLANAPTDSSLFGDHLRRQLLTLQNRPALALAFRQIITTAQPITIDPLAAYQLQSLGLIQLSGDQASPRCQLYRHYFSSRLSN